VNLFVPSRVSWSQNDTACTLTQRTEYPRQSTTQFDFALAHPETFTVYMRIPAWAGPKTTLSVNGSRITDAIEPGKFLALKRAWKDRDRIEVEFDMPLRLEAIDDQDHDNVALMRGPLALFAVGEIPQRMARKHLLSASALAQSSSDWTAQTDAGVLTLRPFSAIMSERYRLYNRVTA
jgi:DUF1680 family protein